MISRRIIMGVVVTGAAAATVVGLASPAYAAVANIVSVGTNTATASVAVQGVPTAAVTLSNTGGTATVTCPASSTKLVGTANQGANSSGTAATVPATGITFGSATYSGASTGGGTITAGSAPCTTSGGTVPVVAKACSTLAVQTTGASTTAPHPPTAPASGQQTPGTVANACFDIYIGGSNSCHTKVTGAVNGNYKNNSPGLLTVDPALASTLVGSATSNPTTGCVGGAFKDGTTYKFSGAFNVTPVTATGPVWVNA